VSGHYKYAESIDFEILLLAYAVNNEPVQVVDICGGETIPEEFLELYYADDVMRFAHNAAFERTCLDKFLNKISPEDWTCTAVMAGIAGLPMKLSETSKALELEQFGKLTTGTALITYFCKPCKPTKTNGGRLRNMPYHAPEKWDAFIEYCAQDVVAEREVHRRLRGIKPLPSERSMYVLDQHINDRGVRINLEMVKSAVYIDRLNKKNLLREIKKITGLENPNSGPQLKKWLSERTNKQITSLDAKHIESLLSTVGDATTKQVLTLKKRASRTSNSKFPKMIQCASFDDQRARGLFQFYGARTGRWAGRLIQLQNLPRTYLENVEELNQFVIDKDYDLLTILYDDPAAVLSQLLRSALIASEGHTFAVADFSAIEARVLAWLAGEEWRMEVFRTHGMIYEASASKMFNLPLDKCTKKADKRNGTDHRAKGKVAELALGYQGAVGALKQMGGEDMGLSEKEMKSIVVKWRGSNTAIAAFWKRVNNCAMIAVRKRKPVRGPKGIIFDVFKDWMTIQLPSKRKLYYYKPRFGRNRFGKVCLEYMGIDTYSRKWKYLNTYGGKITENLAQAIARDLLTDSMLRLDKAGFSICLHVHDEVAAEVPITNAEEQLENMCSIMSDGPDWALGLPLGADGYTSTFYKKD